MAWRVKHYVMMNKRCAELSGEQKHVSTITPQFSPTPADSRNIWKMREVEEMHFNTEATKVSYKRSYPIPGPDGVLKNSNEVICHF